MFYFWGKWREINSNHLYTAALRKEVKRKTHLLDDMRECYLRDIVNVKQLKGKDDPSATTAASLKPGNLDLRGWGAEVPSAHKAKFADLEARGYLSLAGVGAGSEMERDPDGYNTLEMESIPLWGPNECAFLSHHCEACQGVVAAVYARNERVSAALGLVANHEAFVASTKADLAKIPDLEKQAKTLREQMVHISGLLGTAELRIAELQAELSETTKRATNEKAALTKEKDAFEKVAARVPGLEAEIASLTEQLNESKEVSAARERLNVAKNGEIASLQTHILEAKAQSDKAIAMRDARIGELEHALLESGERGLMLAEAERFEREERVPALRVEISNLETEAERRDKELQTGVRVRSFWCILNYEVGRRRVPDRTG